MNNLLAYLPLLNLLIVPVFVKYLDVQIRLTRLEDHRTRVENHLGFNKPQENRHHGY